VRHWVGGAEVRGAGRIDEGGGSGKEEYGVKEHMRRRKMRGGWRKTEGGGGKEVGEGMTCMGGKRISEEGCLEEMREIDGGEWGGEGGRG